MENEYELAIIEKITEARTFLDMSRDEFASLFGMNNASLYKLEKGTHKIFIQRLIDIAQAIKVDINYFFSGQAYPEAVLTFYDRNKILNPDQGIISFLGNLSDNSCLMAYIGKKHLLGEVNPTAIKEDLKKRIGYMLDQLTVSDIESFYSLSLWFMKNQGNELLSEKPSGVDEIINEDFSDPLLFVTITKQFDNLYEAAKGPWKVSRDKFEQVKYILPVIKDEIKEVYSIEERQAVVVDGQTHFTFNGSVAEDPIRRRYVGKSKSLFKPVKSSSPIQYHNV